MTLQSATCVLRSASLKKGKKSTSNTFHPRFRTDYVSTTALEVQKLQPSTTQNVKNVFGNIQCLQTGWFLNI